jgi:hypothetical protein
MGIGKFKEIFNKFYIIYFFPIIKKWKLEFEFEKIGGDVVDIKYI